MKSRSDIAILAPQSTAVARARKRQPVHRAAAVQERSDPAVGNSGALHRRYARRTHCGAQCAELIPVQLPRSTPILVELRPRNRDR